jgi:hypothetical protein
LILELI